MLRFFPSLPVIPLVILRTLIEGYCRVPQLRELALHLPQELSILRRDHLRVPFPVYRKSLHSHIGASNDHPVYLTLSEHVSLRMKSRGTSCGETHLHFYIPQSIELPQCSRLTERKIIRRKNFPFHTP